MTTSPAGLPFMASRYELRDGLALTPMTQSEAGAAGELCGAIEPWLSYPFSAAELTRFFAAIEPHAPRFTLSNSGVFAGALVVRRDWFRGPYVHMLVVAPPFQGQGFGAAMLEFVEREARRNNDRNMWIAVTDSNTGAAALYRRFGFTEIARLDGLVRDGKTEILMRKRLTPAA